MSEIEEIIDALIKFRNDRDWEQFHNSKDLAVAISVEANELLELFLWKHPEDAGKEKIKEELADIFAFAFLLAQKHGFDVKEIILSKKKNQMPKNIPLTSQKALLKNIMNYDCLQRQ